MAEALFHSGDLYTPHPKPHAEGNFRDDFSLTLAVFWQVKAGAEGCGAAHGA